jgi:peroxin-4
MMANRLHKELKDIQKGGEKDIVLRPHEDDLFRWSATIIGPSGSPYEGGHFHMDISVPQNYPLSSPKVTMLTKCFHPNIHFKTGEICLDILKTAWTPAWTLTAVCRAIIALLHDYVADSPLNCDAGNLIRNNDIRGFNSMAKMYTKLYAQKPHS